MDQGYERVESEPSDDAAAALPGLEEVEAFGSNPGNLRMLIATPGQGGTSRALVVVLHGCNQTAAGYDRASGWSRLAADCDFVVLYPEQRRANNEQGCFSWFRPQDVTRVGGEAESIRQMVSAATERFDTDPKRVFVCGLSAGGAMACAMMATYPEVFAAGAVIAGLPYGAASSTGSAFEAMYRGRVMDASAWGDLVRTASGGHSGTWPRVAIWHGLADRVVTPLNADELVKQWTDVHGLGAVSSERDQFGPASRRTWCDAAGHARVTEYLLAGLGHGAPVDDPHPPAPFFLSAGLSSTQQIAADFGLTAQAKPVARRIKAMLGLS